MIPKIMYYIMLINLSFMIVFGWMLFSPVKLPVIYNEPFPVFPSEVKRGESLSYYMEFNKIKPYPVDVFKNIICDDGNLVTLAPNKTSVPLGQGSATVEIVIPEKTSLGVCKIVIEHNYKINPVRQEERTLETQPFVVYE